jgi:isoquinoline 1-oxidoreductase beta subunit
MEPMNATAHVREDGVEIWAPTQSQTLTQSDIAEEFGFEPPQVHVHTTFLGGGFGRRFERDFIRYAAIASKAVGAPVKVLWSREEDMRHDYYRPASMVRLSAALDESGAWSAFRAHITSPSIEMRFGRGLTEGVDRFAVEGIDETLYRIPNQQIEYGFVDAGVPIGFWRAVGHSQNAFFMEAFVDEVAHAADSDPLDFRLRLLRESPRQAAVVSRVSEMSGWGKSLPEGRFRGLAAHHSHGSHTAQVAEISIESDRIRVHRVYCAFDCGVVVNPDTVEAQLESGIIFGLTAALHGEITLERGSVQQGNFPDYPMVTLATAPSIDVYVMKSSEAPGGVGEPSTPPIAPAVANAVFAATGKRIRKLPIRI